MSIFDNPLKPPKKKKDEGRSDAGVGPPKPTTPAPAPVKEDIKYTKDPDTGRGNMQFSDGRSFTGLKSRDAVRLAAGYRRSLDKTTLPEPEAPIPVVPEVAQPTTADLLPQLQTPTTAAPDALTQSITQNVQDYTRVDDLTNPLERIAAIPSTINKLTSFANKLPGGKSVVNALSVDDENVRRYLQDYSNENNFNSIVNNVKLADDKIAAAKAIASTPGYSGEAIKTYNEAQAEKRRAIAQLKLIASRDQRDYVGKVREQLTELEAYFTYLKVNDDLEMASKLQKGQMLGVANG